MEPMMMYPGRQSSLQQSAANNRRPAHRHDQSEGSEFLDDVIHMSDLYPNPAEMQKPEMPWSLPASETEVS